MAAKRTIATSTYVLLILPLTLNAVQVAFNNTARTRSSIEDGVTSVINFKQSAAASDTTRHDNRQERKAEGTESQVPKPTCTTLRIPNPTSSAQGAHQLKLHLHTFASGPCRYSKPRYPYSYIQSYSWEYTVPDYAPSQVPRNSDGYITSRASPQPHLKEYPPRPKSPESFKVNDNPKSFPSVIDVVAVAIAAVGTTLASLARRQFHAPPSLSTFATKALHTHHSPGLSHQRPPLF
ncbi:uncharacterized protein BDZ83DRAFT_650496 [Colletotrichum acutatum]|uniref:Transmembrane protein n=1 Tax=Glomerella acutata TaxID=27357 RepID=A0AAD8UMY5_GLOAC|nr:uncharacterized protein BDZ83DRAFT_650496 [Colletotrichum acutatum]KAK1726318.1 hypothetical protein BDZ83DRAFT_650496 [Colletotrichum acutatum]